MVEIKYDGTLLVGGRKTIRELGDVVEKRDADLRGTIVDDCTDLFHPRITNDKIHRYVHAQSHYPV